jgi:hypothetical protein
MHTTQSQQPAVSAKANPATTSGVIDDRGKFIGGTQEGDTIRIKFYQMKTLALGSVSA